MPKCNGMEREEQAKWNLRKQGSCRNMRKLCCNMSVITAFQHLAESDVLRHVHLVPRHDYLMLQHDDDEIF